jgi:polyisoprenoid-binding protein YceI
MKLLALSALSSLPFIFCTATNAQTQGSWRINSQESTVTFVTFRSGHIPATGFFSNVSGKISFDGKKMQTASVEASIPLATINTGMPKRDSDLKSKGFFDVQKFLTANFKSRGIRVSDEKRFIMSGELDLHGVKKIVDLAVDTPVLSVQNGKEHLRATAATLLTPADFNLSLLKLHPEGTIKVDLVELEFVISAEKESK